MSVAGQNGNWNAVVPAATHNAFAWAVLAVNSPMPQIVWSGPSVIAAALASTVPDAVTALDSLHPVRDGDCIVIGVAIPSDLTRAGPEFHGSNVIMHRAGAAP
jgi:hypothetical protein